MQLDKILLEIMSRKVAAVADEMALTLKRTSRSSFVKEAADFGVGVADLKGRIFAWPSDSTVSGVSSIFYPIEGVLKQFDDLEPGDVIGTNDAYTSDGLATHLPDYHLVRPYFHDGKIVAYGWCFCHFSDVGGRTPGSVSSSNADIFQEGLRVPPIKLVKRGVLNEDFVKIFRANSRTPDVNMGDFKALLAALHTGAQRIERLIERHGAETLLNAQEQLQAYSESKSRTVLRQLPDGVYEFWDYVDDDLVSRIPYRIRLKVTIADGLVNIDLTGTDPQVEASFNYPSMGKLRSGFTRRIVTFICTCDKTIPFNAGIFRPLSITNPPGHVLNAEYPDAISCRVDTTRRLNDVMNGILLMAAPERMAAPAGGASVTLVLAERAAQGGKPIVNVIQSMRGGMGAYKGGDGVDARDVSYVNMKNQRLETIENQSGVIVHEYDIRPDSGGPGQWRGGVGQAMTFEVLKDGSAVLVQGADRLRFPGWGVLGGRPAAPFRIVLNRGRTGERQLSKIDRLQANAGDFVTVMMPGGSGYGDPFLRDPELVRRDARFGFVSREGAERDYGVVIGAGGVDVEATARLRRTRQRENVRSDFDFGPEREAWEKVFDDATMLDLNRRLFALPKSERQAKRRQIFERTVPDLPASGEGSVAAAIGDPDAARARLRQAIRDVLGERTAAE
ncbi:MAG: hydantoinase B/oxoprolinase family protein [Alphaproteobacteria bacterium]|nr:hydantoinase B/oxoprolinase family protein [Alphaproteobacteria bacterium]